MNSRCTADYWDKLATETKDASDSWKMASRLKTGMGFMKLENLQYGEESSESDNETEPVKSFVRKLSTKRDLKTSVCISSR